MFDLEQELKKLPDSPGVYIMHDASDAIIYVGKAVNLSRRVHSYFRESTKKTEKIRKMVSLIDHFETILTDSELEALVLENNLIKEHRPKYNTLLKDDKTYPYIKVTLGEDFPRVLFSRTMKKDRSRYFGPFTSAGAVKDVIELLSGLYKIRTCSRRIEEGKPTGERACLNYHMQRCSAPCIGAVSKEEYEKNLRKALDFLGGNYSPVIRELEEKMQEASEAMEYEEAGRLRDLLSSVRAVAQKQKITDLGGEDKDVIAIAQDETARVVQVFFMRDGKLIGREHYYLKNSEGETIEQALCSFVKQYYAGTPYLPRTVLLSHPIEETQLLEQWLSERKGSRVYFAVPRIGQKEKLVELALRNAQLVLSSDQERIAREYEKTRGAVRALEELIGLSGIRRMEAYDISNTNGYESVGSMVVFEDGRPRRSDYRKFKIKTVEGPNDYASMKEVLTRRFSHGLAEREQAAESGEDTGRFSRFPDLLLMDGGRGQVSVCEEVLASLGLSIPVAGMVKDDRHRTRGIYYLGKELLVDTRSEYFKLITRIQDEAHRFAIEYHRSLRKKASVTSVLDSIRGVGPARRKALMRSFDSLEQIRAADRQRLLQVPGIPPSCADAILAFFHPEDAPPEGNET